MRPSTDHYLADLLDGDRDVTAEDVRYVLGQKVLDVLDDPDALDLMTAVWKSVDLGEVREAAEAVLRDEATTEQRVLCGTFGKLWLETSDAKLAAEARVLAESQFKLIDDDYLAQADIFGDGRIWTITRLDYEAGEEEPPWLKALVAECDRDIEVVDREDPSRALHAQRVQKPGGAFSIICGATGEGAEERMRAALVRVVVHVKYRVLT